MKICEKCLHQSEFKSVECGSCMVSYYNGEKQGLPSNFKPKPQTHADRIRAMSDEELAKWIDWLFGRCEWCDTDKMAADECNDVECTHCILEWLKQPVGDE